MISKSTVDKIFSAVRVEEVVGEYIKLKRTGANYKGLSPFHDEKTPSFVVSPSKQIWKDFSSGKGGTAVSFLMEIENFSYPDALRYLAKKYGIEVEEDFRELSDDEKKSRNQIELLYKVHEIAGNFFYEQLTETEEGQNIGYSYFKERGLNDEIIKKFQLGYSPETRNAFTKIALEKGYEKELLEKSGLSIFNENSTEGIDRFRDRVIFPIHNFSGRILGFGARTLKSSNRTSKYINSPETEIYHKSNILYGISQSKQAISKENNCFLVEGYMDVLSFHQVGIENTVASSGTALTKEQIRLIKRLTPNVTILFDGDSAGIKASFRSIDILLEEDMNIRVMLFPDGHDPDSFTRKYPQEYVKDYIKENSVDFIQYKLNILEKDVENDPIKKAELVREIVRSIAFVVNPLKQEILIQQTSRLLGISEKNLFSELYIFSSNIERQSKHKTQEVRPKLKKVEVGQSVTVIPLLFLEEKLIDLMLKFGNKEIIVDKDGNTLKSSVIQEILNHFDEDSYQIQIPMNEKIVNEIIRSENIGENPSQFFYNLMDEEINQKLANVLIEPYDISNWKKFNIYFPLPDEDVEKLVYDTILRHKREYILKIIKDECQKMQQDTENYDKYIEKIKMLSELKIKLDEALHRVI